MTTPAIPSDAYGTLIDVYTVGTPVEKLFPESGAALTVLRRHQQIEYTRLQLQARSGKQARLVQQQTGDAQ